MLDVDTSAGWTGLTRAFLAHDATTGDRLAAILDRNPGSARAHALRGLFLMLLGRAELVAPAAASRDAARAAGPRDAGDRALLTALDRWLTGNLAQAVAALSDVLRDGPGDAMLVKIDHSMRFLLGDATGMRRNIEAALPAYADHPSRGYMLGCHAFALEETGAYAAAEATGRAGLDLCADDAWGLHAVTHVHDMTGRARDGLAWLDGREAAWAHCNNFRYHVWWHKALMHLDLGQIDAVLHLYDTCIRADRTDDYRDIANAASLLSRLELEGAAIGDRWQELADLAAARTEDACLIFADLHYLLALIGGDRAVERRRLVARIARSGARRGTDLENRMARPGTDAAQGLDAWAEGDHARAYRHLQAARADMPLAGGSHAQRDVFERLTIDAALRAGLTREAGALLDDRQRYRGGEDGYAAARRALLGDMAGARRGLAS